MEQSGSVGFALGSSGAPHHGGNLREQRLSFRIELDESFAKSSECLLGKRGARWVQWALPGKIYTKALTARPRRRRGGAR